MKVVVPLRRVLSRFAVVGAVLTAGSSVHAQTATITLPPLLYRQQPLRPPGRLPHWVSQADCLAKDVISFPITMVGYLGYTLQVWAGNQGVDCTPANERQPGGAAECWLVYSAPATISPVTVDISAVDIVARNLPGTATPLAYPEACSDPSAPPAGQQLTLSFFLVSSGTSIVPNTLKQWTDIGYDTSPPTEASALTASPGETRVELNWTDAVDSDIVLYNFYCDPAPGSLPTADGGLTSQGPPLGLLDTGGVTGIGAGGLFVGAGGFTTGIGAGGFITGIGAGGFTTGIGAGGTTGFGGTDFGGFAGTDFGTAGDNGLAGTGGTTLTGGGTTTTTASQPNCTTNSALQPGVSPVLPTSLAHYQCGSVNGIYAKTGTVSGLINKVRYVFSVAAVDHVGNVGVFANNNACATPINVTDFFELYKAAGGKAGGGICSISNMSGGARTGILLAGGVLALAFAARRSLRRRK